MLLFRRVQDGVPARMQGKTLPGVRRRSAPGRVQRGTLWPSEVASIDTSYWVLPVETGERRVTLLPQNGKNDKRKWR